MLHAAERRFRTVIVLFVLLVSQLFNLGLISDTKQRQGKMLSSNEEQSPSGAYDRHGEKVTFNIVVYDLEALYVTLSEGLDVNALAHNVGYVFDVVPAMRPILTALTQAPFPRLGSIKIIRALDTTTSMRLREQLLDFPNLSLTPSSKEYVHYAPALLGYMDRLIDELKGIQPKAIGWEIISAGGIESEFEYHQGENGETYIIEDVYGAERGKYEEGINDIKANPGNDLFLPLTSRFNNIQGPNGKQKGRGRSS